MEHMIDLARTMIEASVNDAAERAEYAIRKEACEANEVIAAMHNFAQRSLAQKRRWHLFRKLHGGSHEQNG